MFLLYNKKLLVILWFITRPSFQEARPQLCLKSGIENEHSKGEILFGKHSNLQSCKTNKYPVVYINDEFYACKVAIAFNILLTLSLQDIAQK